MTLLSTLPIIFTIIVDSFRQIIKLKEGMKDRVVDKRAVRTLVSNTLSAIGFFNEKPKEYEPLVMELVDDLIDLVIHSYNASGKLSKKVFLDMPLGKEVKI